jgi:hypothetical protein
MKFLKIFLSIFLFFSFLECKLKQKNVDKQSLLWARYNQLELNNKWSVHTEIDNSFINPVTQILL